jgi:hypothetical protein
LPIQAENLTGASLADNLLLVRQAALDRAPVSGLTHKFYRYPARFSPRFAAAAIEAFSRPGELVLDPYMGGGTSIVEALTRGRQAVGCDLNSLAVFVARAKTALLSKADADALREWADEVIPKLSYWLTPDDLDEFICERRTKNLTLPEARPIKKVLALALRSLSDLPNGSIPIARCALLNTGQWALNGRSQQPSLKEFRERLRATVHEMIEASTALRSALGENRSKPVLINDSAAALDTYKPFSDGTRARLVVTSPPYPGIHMLYHRWQVDGRRESPAPYWLAQCNDGHGASFYNFAYRSEDAADKKYFAESLKTLTTIRKVVEKGAVFVQLIAFANPKKHLAKYLSNMEQAGFSEIRDGKRRLWRNVPGRKWHATLKGTLPSAREVVLIHEAV